MKVLAFVILIVGSSSGIGSGPYLPSGWRPSGPAFYLPTEVEKPVAVPLKDVPVISQESETSGSSYLQEYGPPKLQIQVEEPSNEAGQLKIQEATLEVSKIQEVSQDLTQQGLPELVTEQAFEVIETKVEDIAKSAELGEQVSQVTEETAITTESEVIIQEQTTESEAENSYTESITEEKTETVKQEIQQIAQETDANSNIVAAVEQRVEEEVTEVKAAEEGVKSISEALVNLENEIKAQQIQTIQEVIDVKTAGESSGSSQALEGFVEYGPPGFTEYGPPKGNLRTEPVTEEKPDSYLETKETRRRRFSPKFKTTKRKQ